MSTCEDGVGGGMNYCIHLQGVGWGGVMNFEGGGTEK